MARTRLAARTEGAARGASAAVRLLRRAGKALDDENAAARRHDVVVTVRRRNAEPRLRIALNHSLAETKKIKK